MEKLLCFLKDEKGAAAVEYGVLIALIIAALVGVIITLRDSISDAFQACVDAIGGD